MSDYGQLSFLTHVIIYSCQIDCLFFCKLLTKFVFNYYGSLFLVQRVIIASCHFWQMSILTVLKIKCVYFCILLTRFTCNSYKSIALAQWVLLVNCHFWQMSLLTAVKYECVFSYKSLTRFVQSSKVSPWHKKC